MYAELHARSAFSFLEGASLPEELVAVCAQLNLPAMALLDTNGVYGAPRFHMAAQKAKIKAHIGAEVTVQLFKINQSQKISDCRLQIADLHPKKRSSICNLQSAIYNPFRLPLLVASRTGYQNLCRLITKMKLRSPRKGEGAVLREELEEHAEGLICLTGGHQGPLAAALQQGGIDAARRQV